MVKGGSKHKKILKKAVRGNLVLYGSQEEQREDGDVEEEGVGEEDEMKQKDKKKRKKVEYSEYCWVKSNFLNFSGISCLARKFFRF